MEEHMSDKRQKEVEKREKPNRDRSDEARERYIRAATADREFKLPDDVPFRDESCKGAWVEEKQLPKFLKQGWEYVLDNSNEQVIKEIPMTQGMEIFYGMQIPLDWYLSASAERERKRKAKEAAINKGHDEHSAVNSGKDGFFVLDQHKVETREKK